jgi:anti-sigma B factor antagonist
MAQSPPIGRVDLPDEITLAPMGDLDPHTGPALAQAVAAALSESDAERVRIDLGAVDIVDSSGLRALLDADRMCRAAGRELIVSDPGPAARRILAITALDARLTIAQTELAPPGEGS